MEKANTVSIKAFLVNGDEADYLEDVTAEKAIEFLVGETGVPVQTLSIRLVDNNGKKYTISIFPGGVVVRNI